jgi:hypothetical protein
MGLQVNKSWHILKCTVQFPGKSEENHKQISQGNLSAGRVSKWEKTYFVGRSFFFFFFLELTFYLEALCSSHDTNFI